MFILRRTVVGEVNPGDGGKQPWQAVTLRAIADDLARGAASANPTYYEATWSDGTRLDVAIEPEARDAVPVDLP